MSEQSAEGPRFTLAYWDIRGLGAPVRMLLWFCDQKDFENKHYTVETAGEWFGRDKLNMGFDFPNLPYLIDHKDGLQLTQSLGIMAYLAHTLKPELTHVPEKYQAKHMMVHDQAVDFRNALVKACYGAKSEEDVQEFKKGPLAKHFALFEKWLSAEGRDGPFLFGPLHYLDFYLAEHLQQCQMLFKEYTKDYPAVEAYINAFFTHEGISSFRDSPYFMKGPINASMAFINCNGD